jgi:hypothetical protein
MSLTRVKYDVPACQRERVEVACDLCGKKATVRYNPSFNRVEWPCGNYDVLETGVFLEDGDRYPEGGSTTTTEFHVCPDCFRNKLVPWFAAQGVSPAHEDRET